MRREKGSRERQAREAVSSFHDARKREVGEGEQEGFRFQ